MTSAAPQLVPSNAPACRSMARGAAFGKAFGGTIPAAFNSDILRRLYHFAELKGEFIMATGIQNRVGQYLHADGAARRYKIGKDIYIIGIAGACDAFGLIGPEYNGIFILNDTRKAVVLDRHCEQQSGYFGPSKEQWAEFKRIAELPAAAFRQFCTNNPRFRGSL